MPDPNPDRDPKLITKLGLYLKNIADPEDCFLVPKYQGRDETEMKTTQKNFE
jgi:hypothetical protein